MTSNIIRRFRKEIRDREDITPNATVILTNDPKREGNVLAAKHLLEAVFHGRITVEIGENGILVGSRDEAAALRLQAYTQDKDVSSSLLLQSLTKEEIEKYLKDSVGIDAEVYIPKTPEAELLDELASTWSDVRYGA